MKFPIAKHKRVSAISVQRYNHENIRFRFNGKPWIFDPIMGRGYPVKKRYGFVFDSFVATTCTITNLFWGINYGITGYFHRGTYQPKKDKILVDHRFVGKLIKRLRKRGLCVKVLDSDTYVVT